MGSFTANEVTDLLRAWSNGEEQALAELTPLVYEDLYRVARQHMSREKPGHVLQNTALISELYLRLARLKGIAWQGRTHFLAVCARLMRRILIDYARSTLYMKRGGQASHLPFNEASYTQPDLGIDLAALDHALQNLAGIDERKAQVVELRFFGGLSIEETAEVLHVSEDTVKRDWKFAKHWLWCELIEENDHGE